ncbi:MAG: glycosyltransferase family 4 protein [Polaromonas sp.]
MKKIIFFGGNLNHSGGTERVSSLIANGLARRGYQILLISDQGGDIPFFELDASVRTASIFQKVGRNIVRVPQLVARLRRLLIDEKPDVIITVESMLALFSVPATFGLPVRHICWEHFHFKIDLGKRGRRFARQLAARFCDDIVTLTERDKLFWSQGSHLKAQIQAIPNPCPFPVQVSHTLPDKSRLVLAMGRLASQKGFDLLLEAWQKVVLAEPNWKLRIVGSGSEGQSLNQLSSDLNLSDSVSFIPNTFDVQSHYREAAIYCLSSRFEGFPMILLEAIAFGVPVVSFDCNNGPAEILESTGAALVPAEDSNALADNLLRFIRDPLLRADVGQAEKLRAEVFQLDSVVDQWVKLLNPTKKASVTTRTDVLIEANS